MPLSSVLALETGQAVSVRAGDRTYPATLSSLGMRADDNDRSYTLEAEFEHAKDQVFRAGQAAIITLP